MPCIGHVTVTESCVFEVRHPPGGRRRSASDERGSGLTGSQLVGADMTPQCGVADPTFEPNVPGPSRWSAPIIGSDGEVTTSPKLHCPWYGCTAVTMCPSLTLMPTIRLPSGVYGV